MRKPDLSPAERACLLGEINPADDHSFEQPEPPLVPRAVLRAPRVAGPYSDPPVEPAASRLSTADPAWQAIRRLFDALERPWADGLGTLARTTVIVRLARFASLTFGQLLLETDPPTCFAILRSERWEGRAALECEPPVLRGLLDRWLGGQGAVALSREHPPTDIELRLARRLVQPLVAAWRDAWPNLGPMAWEIEQLTTHPSRVRAWPAETEFLVAAFEVVVGEATGFIRLALPAALLLPRLDLGEARGEPRSLAAWVPAPAGGELVVSLRWSPIAADDLAQLTVGDILTTGHPVAEPLEATIEGRETLPVRLGTLDGQLAVRCGR